MFDGLRISCKLAEMSGAEGKIIHYLLTDGRVLEIINDPRGFQATRNLRKEVAMKYYVVNSVVYFSLAAARDAKRK